MECTVLCFIERAKDVGTILVCGGLGHHCAIERCAADTMPGETYA